MSIEPPLGIASSPSTDPADKARMGSMAILVVRRHVDHVRVTSMACRVLG
jgi:hypothetical protein